MGTKLKYKLRMDRCTYCRTTENLSVDHKIPKIQGGTDDVKNLQCLCEPCNQMKSSLSQKQVMRIFKWLVAIDKGREAKGKKGYYQKFKEKQEKYDPRI